MQIDILTSHVGTRTRGDNRRQHVFRELHLMREDSKLYADISKHTLLIRKIGICQRIIESSLNMYQKVPYCIESGSEIQFSHFPRSMNKTLLGDGHVLTTR